MSHGNSRVGRHSDPRRDSRHDLEGNAVAREVFGLLGPATENQRVAPLEPDDHPSGPGVLEQERVDLILVERAMPARFAGTDPDRMGRSEVEQPGAGQMVVNHHIGVGHDLCPAQRSRVRGPLAPRRPDKRFPARAHAVLITRWTHCPCLLTLLIGSSLFRPQRLQ